MTIKASIVADSVNPSGNRLTTFLLKYPRSGTHEELLTHRALSRNSGSSRAIPFSVNVRQVLDDPWVPEWWGVKSAGMQAPEDVSDKVRDKAENIWLDAMDYCVNAAEKLEALGIHKEMPNRLIQTWSHIEIVLSATEFKNWFLLRDENGAAWNIRNLAHEMRELYNANEPRRVPRFSTIPVCSMNAAMALDAYKDHPTTAPWHLPFIEPIKIHAHMELLPVIKESIAHAAWVSYGNAAGKEGFTQEDVDRVYDKLVGSQPVHASPSEHVAVACSGPHRHGNFVGWCQWRQFLPDQSGGDYLS